MIQNGSLCPRAVSFSFCQQLQSPTTVCPELLMSVEIDCSHFSSQPGLAPSGSANKPDTFLSGRQSRSVLNDPLTASEYSRTSQNQNNRSLSSFSCLVRSFQNLLHTPVRRLTSLVNLHTFQKLRAWRQLAAWIYQTSAP